MAEKKDFMKELAKQVENEKKSQRNDIEIEEEVVEEVEIPEFKSKKEKKVFDRPKSFEQESFTVVNDPKPKRSKKGLLISLISIAVVVVAIVVYLLLPKISVPNFVGKKMGDVSNWAKQNKMESSAIAVSEPVFSNEYDQDVIISQSVMEGKKVRKDTPITFVVSKGADPEESVAFPDLNAMNADEIKQWIAENKLSKAKVTLKFSDDVEEGAVISYKLKNGSESDFKRGTTLTIECSKGKAPAGKVTMLEFVGKPFADVENFAKAKKITVEKVESFSDSKEAGIVISQSVESGKTLDENAVLTVTVSKGKGITIPNFVGFTKEQLDAWMAKKDNNVTLIPTIKHDSAPKGSVIGQVQKPGTVVAQGDPVEIIVSDYLPILCDKSSDQWIGENYQQLKLWCDDKNAKGANIQAGEYGEFAQREYSESVKADGIIEIKCSGSGNDDANGCLRPLNPGTRISYRVSLGPAPKVEETNFVVMTGSVLDSLSNIQGFCNDNSMNAKYVENTNIENIRITMKDLVKVSGDGFQIRVAQGDAIVVEYNPNYVAPATAVNEKTAEEAGVQE